MWKIRRVMTDLRLSPLVAALQHAGKHMEDSIVASYTALLLGCLCQGSQVRTLRRFRATLAFPWLSSHPLTPTLRLVQINVTCVREHLPKGDFSIMTEMLKKFLSFMNLTVSIDSARWLGEVSHCHRVNETEGTSARDGLRFSLQKIVVNFLRKVKKKKKCQSWRNRCLFSAGRQCLMAILQPSDSCAADFSLRFACNCSFRRPLPRSQRCSPRLRRVFVRKNKLFSICLPN